MTVPVSVATGGDGERISGTTVDLSESGASLALPASSARQPVGRRLEVALLLGRQRVWIQAEVLRVARYRSTWVVTVRFVELSEYDQDAVRRQVFAALRRAGTAGLR